MITGMDVSVHDSFVDFRSVAADLYECDPVVATIELTLLRGEPPDSDSPPLLLTVWDGGVLVGAALQTPPRPLLCTGLPESAIDHVVAELVQSRPNLSGVRGPRRIATRFADAWCKSSGARCGPSLDDRLYRLGTLCPPTTVDGEPRTASQDDFGLLVDWCDRFQTEAFGAVAEPADTARSVRRAKQVGDEFLLWALAGEPVSMAGVRSATAGVSRIGPVYTPIGKRGNGFGSAVTAAAAASARDAGAQEVVLFADLANSVSNAIYQRIGFRPVTDFARIEFTEPA
jgi:predicted GNAT family acetyltransferase